MNKKLIDKISEKELKLIIEMYKNNYSIRKISEITGRGRQSLSKLLEEIGLKTEKGNHYRKYTFNYDYFEKIDTKEKAYWLGLLYADGTIIDKNRYGQSDVKISLAKTDEELLLKYKEDLNSTYPIRYDYSKNNKNKNHQVQVICSYKSQKTVNDLIDKGCTPRKSLILTFPTEYQVPKKFIFHFIRGYFDGDGSISINDDISRYYVSIVGTEKFIKELYKYFNFGIVMEDKRKNNSWYFRVNKKEEIIKFYNLVYKDATRYMKRKYNKFKLFLSKYSEN